ncbi:unnamed protein product [Caenorhabditis angaria]|uniref:7TM GPCR serpentine receptor class x (Srx) domain-containing protein n=1 Tax=Caenorhabditis angaria TaxID=860376 RepID=A0A9P1IYB1_9PELO|nr:unnamed protein product [Caenorhabditis angaria]
MIVAYSSPHQIKYFILTNYPNCEKVLENNGIFVTTKDLNVVGTISCVVYLVSGLMIIVSSLCIVRYEVRQTAKNMFNQKTIKERGHVLNILSVIIATILFISALLIVKTNYYDPEEDSSLITAIAFTGLCGASIPNQIFIISRNSAYRSFLFKSNRVRQNSVSNAA